MDQVNQIIARVLAWESAREVKVERIAGLANADYRINVDGEQFVLRVSGQNTERLGINRLHEVAALYAAATAGIGPQVVTFIEPEGHLVTRWINERHWNVSECRTREHVRLLTETVKRIHALPSNGSSPTWRQRVVSGFPYLPALKAICKPCAP